ISAGETEDWFAARGMTLDDFGGWLYQRLCADVLGFDGEDDDAPEDFPDRLRIHLWLSGRMSDIERELRHRVASQIELSSRGETINGDVAYDRLRSEAVNDDARKRKLAQSQMSLIKVEIDALELDTEEAAREACLCVREDQTTLAEVAKDIG